MRKEVYHILNSKATIRHIYGDKGVGKKVLVERLVKFYQNQNTYPDGIIYLNVKTQDKLLSFKNHFEQIMK